MNAPIILFLVFGLFSAHVKSQAVAQMEMMERQIAADLHDEADAKPRVIDFAEGRFLLDDEPVAIEALRERLKAIADENPRQPIIFRTGKDTPFAVIRDMVDACRAAGLINIALTLRDEDNPD